MSYFYRTIMFSSFICGLCFIQVKAQNVYTPISIETISNIENLVQLDIGDRDLAFSPDGNYLAIVDTIVGDHSANILSQTEIYLLDTATQEITDIIDIPDLFVESIAFNSDNNLLAIGGFFGRIIIWDLQERIILHDWQAEDSPILTVKFHPTDTTLYSGSGQIGTPEGTERLTLWDYQHALELATFQSEFETDVHTIVFDTTNNLLFAGIGDDIFYVLLTDNSFSDVIRFNRDSGLVTLRIDTINNRLISLAGRKVTSWDLDSYFDSDRLLSTVLTTTQVNRPYSLLSLEIVPDSSLVFVGDSDGVVTIWRTDDWTRVDILEEHSIGVTDLLVSPNGNFVATIADGTILWGIPD